MAKELIKVIIGVGTVVGRAFGKAIQREILESQNAARARASASGNRTEQHNSAASDALTGISLQEAKQILNIEDIHDQERFEKYYKHLFENNEKSKGGSFYIQSKVVRAKERIDQELGVSNKSENETSQETNKDPTDKT